LIIGAYDTVGRYRGAASTSCTLINRCLSSEFWELIIGAHIVLIEQEK